jgi:hypothetical protein
MTTDTTQVSPDAGEERMARPRRDRGVLLVSVWLGLTLAMVSAVPMVLLLAWALSAEGVVWGRLPFFGLVVAGPAFAGVVLWALSRGRRWLSVAAMVAAVAGWLAGPLASVIASLRDATGAPVVPIHWGAFIGLLWPLAPLVYLLAALRGEQVDQPRWRPSRSTWLGIVVAPMVVLQLALTAAQMLLIVPPLADIGVGLAGAVLYRLYQRRRHETGGPAWYTVALLITGPMLPRLVADLVKSPMFSPIHSPVVTAGAALIGVALAVLLALQVRSWRHSARSSRSPVSCGSGEG